jgi:putative transcriptional regulator
MKVLMTEKIMASSGSRRSRRDVYLDKIDWAALKQVTDEEIDAQIAEDPDTAALFTPQETKTSRLMTPTLRGEDVRTIRNSTGLTQKEFAERFGFSIETIRNYEQGHRQPNGPARTLLRVIANEPEAVARVLKL